MVPSETHLYKTTIIQVQLASTESAMNPEVIKYYLVHIPNNAPVLYLNLIEFYFVTSVMCAFLIAAYVVR